MGISPSDVYTGFPEYKNFNDTNLDKERNIPYRPLVENELQTYPYVIWSNLMNGISKDTELELKQHWIPLQSFSGYPVEYIIFKNPGNY